VFIAWLILKVSLKEDALNAKPSGDQRGVDSAIVRADLKSFFFFLNLLYRLAPIRDVICCIFFYFFIFLVFLFFFFFL